MTWGGSATLVRSHGIVGSGGITWFGSAPPVHGGAGTIQTLNGIADDRNSQTLTLALNPSIGTQITVFVSLYAMDPIVDWLTDSNGHVWTRDVLRSYADGLADGKYAGIACFHTIVEANSAPFFTITFAPNATRTDGNDPGRWWTWGIIADPHPASEPVVDDFETTEQYNTTTVNGGTATPTTTDWIAIFFGMTRGHDTRPMLGPSGYTAVVNNQEDSQHQSGFMWFKLGTSLTAESPTGQIVDIIDMTTPAEIVGCRSGIIIYKRQSAQSGGIVGSGGMTFGGAATLTHGRVAPAPTGGVTWSGTATRTAGRIVTGSGGMTFGGAATFTRTHTMLTSGGLVFGGAADVVRSHGIVGSGGIVWVPLSGLGHYIIGSGGMDFAGAASLVHGRVFPASGGMEWAGAAILRHGRAAVTSGYMTFTGAAVFAHGRSVLGTGGMVFGGSAVIEHENTAPPTITETTFTAPTRDTQFTAPRRP
jgi:hypothetical protein